jgi:hypothetical protein
VPHRLSKIWIFFTLVATYGSLYPFNFRRITLDSDALVAFLSTYNMPTGAGDIPGNLALFFALRPVRHPCRAAAFSRGATPALGVSGRRASGSRIAGRSTLCARFASPRVTI